MIVDYTLLLLLCAELSSFRLQQHKQQQQHRLSCLWCRCEIVKQLFVCRLCTYALMQKFCFIAFSQLLE